MSGMSRNLLSMLGAIMPNHLTAINALEECLECELSSKTCNVCNKTTCSAHTLVVSPSYLECVLCSKTHPDTIIKRLHLVSKESKTIIGHCGHTILVSPVPIGRNTIIAAHPCEGCGDILCALCETLCTECKELSNA